MPRTRDGKKVTRSGGASAGKTNTQASTQAPTTDAQSVTASQPVGTPKRIRLITNLPEPEATQTMMGRAIRPFAKPAQSGTYSPFAVAQARRGH